MKRSTSFLLQSQREKTLKNFYFSAKELLYLVYLISTVVLVVKCSALNVGHLVKTSPESCLSSQMKFKTNCSFSCPQGSQLQGPSYKQCWANGQWKDSAKSVSCKGELKTTDVNTMITTTIQVLVTFCTNSPSRKKYG